MVVGDSVGLFVVGACAVVDTLRVGDAVGLSVVRVCGVVVKGTVFASGIVGLSVGAGVSGRSVGLSVAGSLSAQRYDHSVAMATEMAGTGDSMVYGVVVSVGLSQQHAPARRRYTPSANVG